MQNSTCSLGAREYRFEVVKNHFFNPFVIFFGNNKKAKQAKAHKYQQKSEKAQKRRGVDLILLLLQLSH